MPGLLAAMRRRGWALGEVAAFERRVLERRESFDAYRAGHPKGGRFKDLRRRARRLSELGTVAFATAREGPGLCALVDAFLALERGGWKGEAGTAMACRAATAALAARAVLGHHRPGRRPGRRADARRQADRDQPRTRRRRAPPPCSRRPTTNRSPATPPGCSWRRRSCAPATRPVSRTGSTRRRSRARRWRISSASAPRSPRSSPCRLAPQDTLSLDHRLRLARFEHEALHTAKRVLKRG